MRRSTLTSSAYAAVGVAALVAIWQAGSMLTGNSLLLPSPAEALKALGTVVRTRGFFSDLWASALRVLKGFSLSYALGLAFGAASGSVRPVRYMLSPLFAALRTVPFISLSVLAIIWFPSGSRFRGFPDGFPILASDVSEGMASGGPLLVELTKVYKVPHKAVTGLYLPSDAYLVSAFSQALGMSWKIVVSAESCRCPRGDRRKMDSARSFLETPELFAWTLLLVALGFTADGVGAPNFRWRRAGCGGCDVESGQILRRQAVSRTST